MRLPDSSLSYTLPVTVSATAPPDPPAFRDDDTVAIGPHGMRIVARAAAEERRPLRVVRQNGTHIEMHCLYCGGPLHRAQAPVRVVREGYRLECKLPAWVCKRCDEPYFEPAEVRRVREALRCARARART